MTANIVREEITSDGQTRTEFYMKTKHVVAAIIRDGDKILSTMRGHGEYRGFWEFPGGKVEEGETPEEAVAREIKEELDAEIEVGELLTVVEFDYPDFHLSMSCFWASLKEGSSITLLEHDAAKWLTLEDIDSVGWLPADEDVIKAIKASL